MVPEGIELLSDPLDCSRRVVLPQEFVIELPRRGALVDAAKKSSCASVGIAHDPSLPVDEPEYLIGKHLHLQLALTRGKPSAEEIVESLDSRPSRLRQAFRFAVAPAPSQCTLGRHCGLH